MNRDVWLIMMNLTSHQILSSLYSLYSLIKNVFNTFEKLVMRQVLLVKKCMRI